MTALAQYITLEAEARYFNGESAQPRNVVISFRERSLVIMGFDEEVLAHWPLASLRALGVRGDSAMQLVPHPDSDERIVLSDRQMLKAIAKRIRDRRIGRNGQRV